MPRKILLALVLGLFLMPGSVFAQNTLIQGIVRSDAQAPVAGALVRIPSLEIETVTNDYGQYRIEIPEAQVTGQRVTIEVSSIGFGNTSETVTLVPATMRQNFTIVEEAIQLDEVIVTGTVGRQERRAQAAVVSTIDAAKIAQVAPITSVAQLLQGRSPGVMLRAGSGSTGTSQTIRIRGIASMSGSNSPLVFINGVRMDGGNRMGGVGNQQTSALNDIKIEEIESMEIVKGPAAATLYGSDASAGVINIITKKGRVGSGFTQTFNVEYGQAEPNFTPMANWGECSQDLLEDDFENDLDDLAETYPACIDAGGQYRLGAVLSDNPLQREQPFRDGRYRNINYQLNGGGDNYGVFFSLGADQDDGTLANNEFGHISSRTSFNFLARENLRIEVGFGLSRVKTGLPQNDNNIYGFLGGGFLGDPRSVGSAKDGWYAQRQSLAIGSIETFDKTTRLQPRVSVNFTPWQWFTNRVMVGADMSRSEQLQFWAKNDEGWWDNAPRNGGQIEEDREVDDRYTMEYIGTITQNLMDDLRVDLSFGAQALARRTDQVGVTGRGLVNNEVRTVSSAAELTQGSQSSSMDRDIGVLGRAQVSFMDRVYVTAGLRRDQSDAFGIESKPFYSPSLGLSYVISDEPFFQNVTSFLPEGALTTLRLRTAWGVTGRHPSGGARSTYDPSTNQISADGDIAIGVRPDDTGNPLLRAEKSAEIELGFDAGFLNDRLGLELTYFHKKLTDQIDDIPVPASLGAEGPDVNIGSMENKGFELVANARLITRENVALDVRAIANTLSNKILDLGGVPESATRKVGFPITSDWDFRIKEIHIDNDSVVVSNELEMIGNDRNFPGWEAGVNATLRLFQNLSFYTNFDARGDVVLFDGTNQFRDRQFGMGEAAVRGAVAFGENPDGTPTDAAKREYLSRFGPFYTEDGRRLNRNSVDGGYLQDGGFMRLREASVNYNLPVSLVQRYMKARSATIGLTMRNLRTWTDFTGLDPETGQFLTVPLDKRWTFRFMFTF